MEGEREIKSRALFNLVWKSVLRHDKGGFVVMRP